MPISELPSHLMSHIASLEVDPENRIVMHNHAPHLLAMTFTHPLFIILSYYSSNVIFWRREFSS